MSGEVEIQKYQAMLADYRQGIYTYAEVGGQALRLLFQSNDREAFFDALELEHRQRFGELLAGFDESREPFAIGADPHEIWREMTELKRWFAGQP